MLDEIDDNRLALEAASGDRAAFEHLVRRHYERIYALAWRFAGGPPDSEDLAQEICVTLPARLKSYRGDARFTTWLYRVVINAARDTMRREGARVRAAERFVEHDALERQDTAQRLADANWLRGIIADLKPDLRETAVLVLDEGLTHAEAAEILDVKESTISWRLMEIRKRVKAHAEEEGSIA